MSAQTRARTTLKNDARTLRLPDLWICPGEEYLTPPEDPDEWTGDMWTCTYIHIDQDHRTADLCLRWHLSDGSSRYQGETDADDGLAGYGDLALAVVGGIAPRYLDRIRALIELALQREGYDPTGWTICGQAQA